MFIDFIPKAEASVTSLVKAINKVVINPIIVLIFAVSLVYFVYGLVQYLVNPDNEEIRKSSKNRMLYGIIGLFIMTAVFGIMNIILNTIGEDRIKIDNSGDYQVGEIKLE